MKNFFSLLFFLYISYTLSAQKGAPFLTHYKESREIENQNWAICQDLNHFMLFANRKGVLTFDGQDWGSVRIPIIPYSMRQDPADGKIFVGGENSYGYLRKDQMGLYKYIPISGDVTDIGVITRIVFTDSEVWFYGEESVSRHNLEDLKLELRLRSKERCPFTGMFITPKNTFINVQDKGLFRVESDTLFPIVTGYLTEKTNILFSLPFDNNLVLLGLSSGKISLFDGIKYYDYQVRDEGYLRDNILSEGICIGDSLYAFSTLDGGVLVVAKTSGKVRYTINNQNELPDDEVFAIGPDNSGGLWISHQFGLTRADLNLPIENFSIYPGLNGNLTTSAWHNGELYAGTSEGVFYLAEVKNYSEIQIYVKNVQQKTEQLLQVIPANVIEQEEGGRKNIFTRIFGKKIVKGKEEPVVAESEPEPEPVRPEPPAEEKYVRRTINKLKSINYIYKKVEGFNEKCRQLISTENGILAATNKGLLVINNHKAEVVTGNHYINFVSWRPVDGKYYVAAGNGYFTVKNTNGKWVTDYPDPEFTDPVYSIIRTSSTNLWMGVDNAALRVDLRTNVATEKYKRISIENDYPQRYYIDFINDTIFLYTESGIYFYDNNSVGFLRTRIDKSFSASKTKYIYPLSNMPWLRHGDDWIFLKQADKIVENEMSLLKIFGEVISVEYENNNLWVVDGENRLFRIDLKKPLKINPEIDVFVKTIYDERGTTFDLSNIVLSGGDNIVNFSIVAPGYLKRNTTLYQYAINKVMPDWSPWSVSTNYNLMIPKPGDYTLQVRAKDLWGNIGKPQTIKFTIKAPFTQTTFFYLILVILFLLLLFFFIRFREKQLQKTNKILEEKVKERTAEIEAQKEEITSSIEYASRIQMAMLPVNDHFIEFFSDYFVIFKPRDIVSGDFYWIGEGDKNIFFTVADCTGHGVPGAFMSTLGISTLNEIITNNDDLHANTVLDLLREKIKTSLHQTGKEGEAADGMDVAFCVINKNRKTLQYSGAYNPLIIIQGGELKEYKGNRMPIGIYYGEENSFTNYEIKVNKGDVIYIFSDGLTDQFGGPEGAKYKKSNLKKLLSEIWNKPMDEQRKIILNEFEEWRGQGDQIDDITMIGVRI